MRKTTFLFSMYGALVLLLCVPLTSQEPTFVEGQNNFSVELYRQMKSKPGNLCISPYNVSLVLDMAYIGAAGKTKEEMAKTLFIPAMSDDTLCNAIKSQRQFLKTSGLQKNNGTESFQSFTALGLDTLFTPLPAYQEMIKKYFQADIFVCNFQNNQEESLNQINGWVKEKSGGTIPFLLGTNDLSKTTKLVLLAASHFKKAWASAFQKEEIEIAPFVTAAGNRVDVELMRKSELLPFLQTPEMMICELDYAKSEKEDAVYSCAIILPKIKEMFPLVGDSLTNAQIKKWLDNTALEQVELFLPKISLEYQSSLKEALENMGMQRAFSKEADFSGIAAETDPNLGLMIDKVLHRTFLQIDENGTEAAAATAATMIMKAGAPTKDAVIMRCDHPFFIVIREKKTGLFLFFARVEAPLVEVP